MEPELAFAFDLRLDVEKEFQYDSMSGRRGFVSLTGGSVEGPKLTGKVVPGAGDFPIFRPDGVAEFDARYMIEAADGTLIYLRNRGIRRPMGNGAYIRCTPIFDAPVGPHDWLTKTVFVGFGTEHPNGAKVDGLDFKIYEVL